MHDSMNRCPFSHDPKSLLLRDIACGAQCKWSVQYKVDKSTQNFSYVGIDLNLML